MKQIACIVLSRLACEVVEANAQLLDAQPFNAQRSKPAALPLAVTVSHVETKPEAACRVGSRSSAHDLVAK
jgi:hypothetical protein